MVKSKVNKLQNLLSKAFGGDVEIVDRKMTLLTGPGEHYGSVMLAIDVVIRKESGKEEALNLVAKLIPANQMLRIAFDVSVTFKNEVIAYTETVPALVQLQKEFGVAEEEHLDKMLPKCYGARISLDENKNEVDEDAVLLFENLKVLGYKTEDRLVGFDLDAAKLILKDLARFHAVPIALKLLKPDVFEDKVMPALAEHKVLQMVPEEISLAFHNSIMEGVLDIPELGPYVERIQRMVDAVAASQGGDKPQPNEPWATMTHSDYWVSNTMLLRDAKGRPVKNKMVDLQIMVYSSAVRDLLFFLFTSVINSVLAAHYDDLIRDYYQVFIKTLEEFQLDTSPFSWSAFLAEIEEVAPTEVYHILVMFKPICTERGKVQNSLEEFQDSDWSRKDLLGPHHRRKMKDTVLELIKRNWI